MNYRFKQFDFIFVAHEHLSFAANHLGEMLEHREIAVVRLGLVMLRAARPVEYLRIACHGDIHFGRLISAFYQNFPRLYLDSALCAADDQLTAVKAVALARAGLDERNSVVVLVDREAVIDLAESLVAGRHRHRQYLLGESRKLAYHIDQMAAEIEHRTADIAPEPSALFGGMTARHLGFNRDYIAELAVSDQLLRLDDHRIVAVHIADFDRKLLFLHYRHEFLEAGNVGAARLVEEYRNAFFGEFQRVADLIFLSGFDDDGFEVVHAEQFIN